MAKTRKKRLHIQKIAADHATAVGLMVLSIAAVTLTVLLAIRHSPRLPLMVIGSLGLLFLTALNRIRIRQAYRSAVRNLRLARKRHAPRGVILSGDFTETQTPPED